VVANKSFTFSDLIGIKNLIRITRVRQHQAITLFNLVEGADVIATNQGATPGLKKNDLLGFAGVTSQGCDQEFTSFSVDVH